MVKDGQFEAHGALPEDLAHAIFEAVWGAIKDTVPVSHSISPADYQRANDAARLIQQDVAMHVSTVQWKMLNRRPCSLAPATPVAGEYVEVRPGRFDHLIKG